MKAVEDELSRVETVVAALIFLMTQHARTGCPRLALYVSRHLQCLACHAAAGPVLRATCASLHDAWAEASHDAERLVH